MKEQTKYKILTAIRYFGDACFYPFFSLYLKKQGLIEDEIGFILSISPIIGIITNPIYSFICKDMKTTKSVLSIISILEGIIIFIISFTSNYSLIGILTILMAIFGSCHYGLLDSLLSIYSETENIKYSSIRIYGSIFYIISTTIGGFIIDYLGYNVIFGLCMIFFIISSMFYFSLKPIIFKTNTDKTPFREKLGIFKNIEYLSFIILYMLICGTIFSSDSFFSLYLQSRGLDEKDYGLVYSYFVVFEVITLFVLTKTKRNLSSNSLLIISSFLLFVRMLFNYLYLPVPIIIIFSSLRGIGYAFILHVSFQKVVSIVGKEKGTTGIMFMTLFYSSYLALFNFINGKIIKNYDYKTFYLIVTIISLLITSYAILRSLIFKERKVITIES